MAVDAILETLARVSPLRNTTNTPTATNNTLPIYSSLPRQSTSSSPSTPTSTTITPPTPSKTMLPPLPALLSNFTLGFADGLTVPFALTAGLSSLGQTSTVIYAGLAEICAGSISMGIGGYLAARGEARAAAAEAAARQGEERGEGEEDLEGLLSGSEQGEGEKGARVRVGSVDGVDDEVVARHLAPLRLGSELEEMVWAHLRRHGYDHDAMTEGSGSETPAEEAGSFPVITGLSVSLGYLVGGVIPLFPYFFVHEVGAGLLWSFVVCIIALFAFGFGKEFLLTKGGEGVAGRKGIPWPKIRSSAWEGFQMVILGGIAAVAAVLCVRLFDGVLS
ncbi:VIT family-domain-containing protein [Staphylotrichum tortipilum]|uniref:VIT family-domain-containing protein n=1 Tax=Staphylotrichum tortipilum TaxID=2831512 RepID=A0AAN6MGK4_9PEZI|nr:VIT family-domain-containing protein [Staphylotrichum longicolle]